MSAAGQRGRHDLAAVIAHHRNEWCLGGIHRCRWNRGAHNAGNVLGEEFPNFEPRGVGRDVLDVHWSNLPTWRRQRRRFSVGSRQYGATMQSNSADLIERPVTFAYDLRMRCGDCGQVSQLTGADYLRLNDEAGAHMDCEHCAASIHFGPRAAAIRDSSDPALDDVLVGRLAWYHTSTQANWPESEDDYERVVRAQVTSLPHILGDPERVVRRKVTQALHVGTYEAAIENMHRRMHDQADGQANFYLHRVQVNVASDRINPGLIDENDELVGQITMTDLRARGLDAIRYLNVWEATGCVSLAVQRGVITKIQSTPIPVGREESQHSQHILDLLAALDRLAARPGTADEIEWRSYDLATRLEDLLSAHYLPDVSSTVIDSFNSAMWRTQDRRGEDRRAFADTFARHAAVLTESDRIICHLTTRPSRSVDSEGRTRNRN